MLGNLLSEHFLFVKILLKFRFQKKISVFLNLFRIDLIKKNYIKTNYAT
jgi:hypothetical protein